MRKQREISKLAAVVLVFLIAFGSNPGLVFGQEFRWEADRGSVWPLEGEETTYTAPFEIGSDEIRARFLGEEDVEEGKADIMVTPPYELSCSSDETSILISWERKWSDPNYLDHGYGAHGWVLRDGGGNALKSSTAGGSDSYNHTGLEENTEYSYELEAQYWDGERISMTKTCKTSHPPACNITPSFARLTYGQTVDFESTRSAEWYVDGISGGNSQVGAITGGITDNATYTAPYKGGSFEIEARAGGESCFATVSVRPPYSMSCSPHFNGDTGEHSIALNWAPFNFPNHDANYITSHPHSISLWRTLPAPAENLASPPPWQRGDYTNGGLEENQRYYYELRINYAGGPSVEPVRVNCVTLIMTEDMPTYLNAFSYDDKTIFVNWKDNVTLPFQSQYSFEIQRIKATPEKSEDFKAESIPLQPRELKLAWSNNTASTPYYNIIEYSTHNNSNIRFTDNDNLKTVIERIPVTKNPNEPPDEAVIRPNHELEEDKHDLSTILTGLEEGTVYYLRQKTCSAIDFADGWPYTEEKTERILNKEDHSRPEPPCSKYVPGEGEDWVYGITAPNPPLNFGITTQNITHDSIELSWTNQSQNADGLELERFQGNIYEETILLEITDASYKDEDLEPDTNYRYILRSYVNSPEGEKIYSMEKEASATTLALGGGIEISVFINGDELQQAGEGGDCLATLRQLEDPDWENEGECITRVVEDNLIPNREYYLEWNGIHPPGTDTSEDPVISPSVIKMEPGETGEFTMTFGGEPVVLTVNVFGAGKVSVKEGGNFIGECQGPGTAETQSCEFEDGFSKGDTLTLTAIADDNHSFAGGWYGACAGTSEVCTLEMNKSKSVTAVFNSTTSGLGNHLTYQNPVNFRNLLNNLPSFRAPDLIGGSFLKASGESFLKIDIRKIARTVYNRIASLFKGGVTLAQEGEESGYKEYFKSIAGTPEYPVIHNSVPFPYYKDENVEPDTVYIYRVRVVYHSSDDTDYESKTKSPWSTEETAVKSLRDKDGGKLPGDVVRGICLRNSFCDRTAQNVGFGQVSSSDPVTEESEQQCFLNIHCQNVGRSDIRIEER